MRVHRSPHRMRRAYRRMWLVVPCASRQSLRTDSWKDIEEILQSKLATIDEESESSDEGSSDQKRRKKKKGSKSTSKSKGTVSNFVLPRFSIRDSYELFMTRFASKGSFAGLLQY